MVHATSATTAEDSTGLDVPPQSQASPLARFEFESGKGKDGSKVLMVEWDTLITSHEQNRDSPQVPSPESRTADPAWTVSWEGMPVALPVRDRDERGLAQERQLFLLPPGSQVPPDITVTHRTGSAVSAKPLPAIFPEGLGLEAGTKGVLRESIYFFGRLRGLEAWEQLRSSAPIGPLASASKTVHLPHVSGDRSRDR